MILQRSYKMSLLLFNKGDIGHWLPEAPDIEGQISLDNISNVTITAVADNQSLQYNSATTKWENADIVANSIDGGTY